MSVPSPRALRSGLPSAGTAPTPTAISQSVVLPMTAKVTMAATICAGLPSCWPSISRKPSPSDAPSNSAATTNIQPRPRPERSDDHVGRQHRRQQNAAHQRGDRTGGRRGRPRRSCGRPTDRAHDAEIDRKEHADRDQRDFRCLENAEPQNEQRHPGDRGNGAQRLQRRIEQPAQSAPNSRRSRRASVPATTPSAKPAATRSDRRSAWRCRVRRSARVRRSVVADHRGRRHQAAVRPAGAHREFPAAARAPTGSTRPSRTAPAPGAGRLELRRGCGAGRA